MPEGAKPDPRTAGFGAIVLAAGGSSRMGRVKQLLEAGGRTLIGRTVDAVLESGARPVAVVLGANAEAVGAQVSGRGVLLVRNDGWTEGMASSIRVGMAALLLAEPALEAVLITPCDLPALSARALMGLAELRAKTGLTSAARYHGRNATPAVFGRGEFPALMGLRGEEGARGLLNRDPSKIAAEDLPELGFDLDTPSDLDAWMSREP